MLEDLRSIVQQVSAAANLSGVLDIIIDRLKSALAVDVCSIYLFDRNQDRFVLMATKGLKKEAVRQASLSPSEGLVGLVASREEPLNLERAVAHPKYKYIPETGEENYSSFLGVPIIHHRCVLGVLVVQQAEERRFDESEEAFLVTLSAQLSGTIAHAESTGDLSQLLNPDGPGADEFEFQGLGIAPGIAIGEAVIISPVADLFAVDSVSARSVREELEDYHRAVEKTRRDIWNMAHGLTGVINDQERLLFTAYVQMLDDHSLGKEVNERIEQGATAQSAWSEVIVAHVRQFEVMEDAYLKERAVDLRDLGRRVLGHMQENVQTEAIYPDNAILVGDELSAAALGTVPAEKILGLVSRRGSANSHLAILARAMSIPMIVGVPGMRFSRLRGKDLIIDGYRGHIYANPTQGHRNHFESLLAEDRQLLTELEVLRDQPAQTLDEKHIGMMVNTGLMADVGIATERGAEGVGLFRSEVPFFSRQRFPTEEEQRLLYRDHLEAFSPRPVVMRTLDVGGDKSLPYFPIEEPNPFLGWRGIRVTLDHPELFLAQIRAMLKASTGLDNLSILLPMISGISELEMSLELIYRAYDELTEEEGQDITMPPIGAMIEVPSAVFLARDIARRVDFMSVGSNDLTQYILAVDRNNAQVADLFQGLHPAVLGAMNHVVRAAHAEKKPASVCGELASDPLSALLLIAMGYDSLSMNASDLLRVKAMVRQVRVSDLKPLLREALHLPDAASVRQTLTEFITDPGLKRLLNLTSRSSH